MAVKHQPRRPLRAAAFAGLFLAAGCSDTFESFDPPADTGVATADSPAARADQTASLLDWGWPSVDSASPQEHDAKSVTDKDAAPATHKDAAQATHKDAAQATHKDAAQATHKDAGLRADLGTTTNSCMSGFDLAKIASAVIDVRGKAHICQVSCQAQPLNLSCIKDCIIRDTGLSPFCATCYEILVGCSSKRCGMICINPQSQACTDCEKTQCEAVYTACSGLGL